MPDTRTDLLVIGAGPYAYAAAAYARDRGVDTHVVGIPMSFWRDRMPQDMYLRSGPDWYLDANREDTFTAFFEERGLDPAEHDPIPISVFLDHTDWFAARKGIVADQRLVADLTRPNGTFVAAMADGTSIEADKVVAAPGVGFFAQLPAWHDRIPEAHRSHTVDRVTFEDLSGARVAVIGGRQSAYEWAALLCDHGASRVDVVHRHPTPAFEKVSWKFVDAHVDQTLAHRGWWRGLTAEERAAIAQQFWEVGRLTLEHWLVPRLRPDVVTSHPETAVTAVAGDGPVTLTLSDGSALEVDHVVFASGYKPDVARVPYLGGVLDRIGVTDGFPDLSEGFETTLPGLYTVGFLATRDFGPFYGFTKGCPSAAKIVVDEMLR
ncbi:FAD-dependent oxidoreductase [Nocardioides sp. URHA0032]|uniref:FAD-dependent oxidoreductase n=1 Tax=Nocardioides sp. URHA0032 TaxID=1380388 RepID=UPI00048E94CF|nr:FAD-dependent oxidoreductase [Nocardioides sp. URHA0032]